MLTFLPMRKLKQKKTVESYLERDLHRLLTTYLSRDGMQIYAKTIFHEESNHERDNNQKWTHPDIVGVKLLSFKTYESRNFLKVIDKTETLLVLFNWLLNLPKVKSYSRQDIKTFILTRLTSFVMSIRILKFHQ